MSPGSTDSLTVVAELSGEVPAAMAERASSWLARQGAGNSPGSRPGGDEPVRPRPAASVLLVRDHDGTGLQTYLLHRHARMPFAASMVVFPGGGADPGEDARACAVRETREETGVALDPAALVDWAHWITPEFEPRRYDTRFFVAALPNGQQATDVSGETVTAGWQSPSGALADAGAGLLALLPPTRSLLLELSRFERAADVLAAGSGRAVRTVLPRLVETDGRPHFVYRAVGA